MDSMTDLGDLEVILGDVVKDVTHTVARKKVVGTLQGAVLVLPNAQLSMLSFRDNNGEGEVKCNEVIEGPPELDHLKTGLAMGINKRGKPPVTFLELRIAYLDENRWARVRERSETDFDLAVGGSVSQFLMARGASAVGTREQLWGDASRRRRILGVSIPDTAPPETLLYIYGAARLIPLMREIEAGR